MTTAYVALAGAAPSADASTPTEVLAEQVGQLAVVGCVPAPELHAQIRVERGVFPAVRNRQGPQPRRRKSEEIEAGRQILADIASACLIAEGVTPANEGRG